MKKWFKRHFIPHEGNNHRPHFLHRKNTAQLVGIVLVLELILFILPGLNFANFLQTLNVTAVLPGVLSTLTNTERLQNNLPELKENPTLDEVARLKAEDMASKGYFAHTSPEGLTPWYWFEKVGYSYVYAGENLAVNFTDSTDVTEAWMNSPTHRANIVHAAYTEVGTGIAAGIYKGQETVFVAQVYGRPATVTAPVSGLRRSSDFANSPAPTQNAVLGETQVKTPSANRALQEAVKDFLQEAAASPRHTTDLMLYSVLGLVVLALLFNIFIRIHHQHPDLILNGAVVVVIIFAIHLTNAYIANARSLETSFIAFDSQGQLFEQ